MATTSDGIKYLSDTSNGSLCLGIFLRGLDESEGEMIGIGGIQKACSQGSWPVLSWHFVNQKYKDSYRTFGTEFAKAFMKFWWSVPEEAGEFLLQVPAKSADYPPREETSVVARVVAEAHVDDAAKQCALREAGFVVYSAQGGDHGVTCWRNVAVSTTRSGQPPCPTATDSQLQGQSEGPWTTSETRKRHVAQIADGRLGFSVAERRAPTCFQQPAEPQPSNSQITMEIFKMLLEDLRPGQLDVFTLPDSYVEGYVADLSKHFGIALENRRGEIWAGFRACLTVEREEAQRNGQPDNENLSAAILEMARATYYPGRQLRLRMSELGPMLEKRFGVRLKHRREYIWSGKF